MTSHKRSYQHTRPIVVSSLGDQASAQPLESVKLSRGKEPGTKYNEAWLQQLLHRHPTLLPVSEIERGFERMIPLGMEVPTQSGNVDNVFATPEGNLVLVEC